MAWIFLALFINLIVLFIPLQVLAEPCQFASVQLMFNPDQAGCGSSARMDYIFGKLTPPLSMFPKYVLYRAITSNLVFSGTIKHLLKENDNPRGTSFDIQVEVDCFYKGYSSSSTITVTNFDPTPDNGLCTPVSVANNQRGLFYTTMINGTHASINEKGFIGNNYENDMNENAALNYLLCDKNLGDITPTAPERSANPSCKWQPQCFDSKWNYQMAVNMLAHSYSSIEQEFKKECQQLGKDAVLVKLNLAPAKYRNVRYGPAHDKQAASNMSKSGSPLAISLLIYLVVCSNYFIIS